MSKFTFIATRHDGSKVSGVLDSLSVGTARRSLMEQGLVVVSLKEKRSLLKFEITEEKVPRRELMHFSRQMAIFVRTGIPMLEALEVMSEEMTDKVFARVIAEMADSLREGETFADAAEHHPRAFPPYYLGILRSAELTGNLDEVLDQLADYIERDIEVRRRITSALTYPGVVFGFALVAVVVITAFVLPRFKVFFASLDAKLPLPTRMLLAVANFFSNDWFAIVGGVLALIAIWILLSATARGRELRDNMYLRIPLMGQLMQTAVLERFCRVLHSMVASGVPLPEAMTVTGSTTTNSVYRKGINQARSAMMRGEGLAAPLSATGLFPPAARHMLMVGENTGTMDEQLGSAAVYFDRELDYRLKQFTALFEPAVILIVGLLVGFVAIALISAMYGIYRQVHISG
ncbi:MAG TPA: type II secretion system F family protein [Acidimicrobiales bacterium]|nr:type II secretion system F family protein [Acidimicrobiales bacterium]